MASFKTRIELDNAIDAWIANQTSATSTYGDINTWDVSAISDFSYLFDEAYSFDSDIGNWDVSNGTNFEGMFRNATSFDKNIGEWDVSSGTNFSYMFYGTSKFLNNKLVWGDVDDVGELIGHWDVSSGTDFSYMFYGSRFDRDIKEWDVSSGTDFSFMFSLNRYFNQEIGQWDVSSGSDFRNMFYGASAFNRDIRYWNLQQYPSVFISEMFRDATAALVSGWKESPDVSEFKGLTISGSSSGDTIKGGDGNDILTGLNGNDDLRGGDGWDRLIGGAGNDLLYGAGPYGDPPNLQNGSGDPSFNGDDTLIGGDGNDTFYGGFGSNTYNGGAGDDFAVFNFARHEARSISSTLITKNSKQRVFPWEYQTETLSGIEGKAFLEINHGGSFVAGQAYYQDINGDGNIDLFFQNGINRTNGWNQFWITYGDSSGLPGPTSGPYANDVAELAFEHGGPTDFIRGQLQFADINGDGYSDAIWQGKDNQFWANFGSNSGFGGSYSTPSLVNTHGGAFDPDKVKYVDVTGDGAEDLIFHGDDNRFWLSQSNGTNFDNPIHAATHGGPTNFDAVQYADVDGDGKKDMIYHGVDNRFWIGISDGSSFGNIYYSNTHGGDFVTSKVQYADFDGDGKDDMIYQGDDNRFWVSKSDGTKFTNTESTPIASHTYDDFDTDQVNFFDMNGDGKADMVYQGDGNEVWYYESNGSTFDTAEQIADFAGSFTEGSLGLGDIDGDGSGDLFYQDLNNNFYIALNSDFM